MINLSNSFDVLYVSNTWAFYTDYNIELKTTTCKPLYVLKTFGFNFMTSLFIEILVAHFYEVFPEMKPADDACITRFVVLSFFVLKCVKFECEKGISKFDFEIALFSKIPPF